MICRDCRFMKTMDGETYVCGNRDSQNFMEYTGMCCEEECEDGERETFDILKDLF